MYIYCSSNNNSWLKYTCLPQPSTLTKFFFYTTFRKWTDKWQSQSLHSSANYQFYFWKFTFSNWTINNWEKIKPNLYRSSQKRPSSATCKGESAKQSMSVSGCTFAVTLYYAIIKITNSWKGASLNPQTWLYIWSWHKHASEMALLCHSSTIKIRGSTWRLLMKHF